MLYTCVKSLMVISSLQPYAHHPSKGILKTIGNSIDALLRMSTAFGLTVLKEFCCCRSAGDVMFDF